jgi:hypothetical protein
MDGTMGGGWLPVDEGTKIGAMLGVWLVGELWDLGAPVKKYPSTNDYIHGKYILFSRQNNFT